jgi:hypothetical protein
MSNSARGLGRAVQDLDGLHGGKGCLMEKSYVIFGLVRKHRVDESPRQWTLDTASEMSLRGATTAASLCSCLCGRLSC